MKKYVLVLVLLVGLIGFSQEEKDNYRKVIQNFKTNYNKGDYESIFAMFDNNMKKSLPINQTISFFKNNVGPAGKIKVLELYKVKNSVHVYKTRFDKMLLDISLSLDADDKINGLYIAPHIPNDIEKLERNTTKMMLPFNEEWFVFWGGTELEDNYHVAHENQKYAYDLVIVKDGKTHEGDPKKNENYYVFGKELIAPCDAKVVKVISGVHDNIPGEFNPAQVSGNTVVLETAEKEYILFGHIKEGSIAVEEGQEVKQGDVLGQCGNSGNTSEPHLHLSLQNTIDMNIATGGKLFFEEIMVNGEVKKDYIPVKGDKIQNINKEE